MILGMDAIPGAQQVNAEVPLSEMFGYATDMRSKTCLLYTSRVKTYEAIVKGQNIPKPGIPESFKVLIKELQSLGLDVKVLDKDNQAGLLT